LLIAIVALVVLCFIIFKWLNYTTNHGNFETVPNLKGKSIDVEMMITDEAGNGSIACLSTINIEGEGGLCAGDVMPPIAVVVSELEVSFSSKTTILPEDIDNFSYDLCSQDVLLKISKGTDVCANGSDQEMDSIELCSQEIGSDVIVVLTVYDEAGNSSTAWTKVSVVD